MRRASSNLRQGHGRRELERIAEEATVDAYGEYEQISSWCEYLQETIRPPRRWVVGRKVGTVIGFDTTKNGTTVLAVVEVDGNEYRVAAETITIVNRRISKYLEAFKQWL